MQAQPLGTHANASTVAAAANSSRPGNHQIFDLHTSPPRHGMGIPPVSSGNLTAAVENSTLYTLTFGDGTTIWNITIAYDNTTSNHTNDTTPAILAPAILIGIFLSAIICCTILGNVLVLLAVFVNSHLRSTTNYFIVNLACADLLLGTTVLPFSASLEITNHWVFGQIFCDIWAAVDVLCCTASIMSLCVISIDRYIGVTRPLQHTTIITERRALYICIIVWLLAIAISVAPLFGWKEPPPDDPAMCEVTKQLGYVLFSVSGSFYIPLIIILVVYFRVYREALTQSRFLATGVKTSKLDEASSEVTLRIHTGRASNAVNKTNYHQSSSSSEHSEGSNKKNNSRLTMAGKIAKFKREKKAAKTLGIVVGVFIICWFPFFFILPLEALCHGCNIPDWLFKIIFWLGYCNSMMNPIIYACSSREFKRAFLRILRCRLRRKPRTFVDDSTSFASHTEMNKIDRFPTLRMLSRKQGGSILRRSKRGCTGNRILLQTSSTRRRLEKESPIASLKLLQKQQRKDTVDTIMSDDESIIQGELSDDEKSDISSEPPQHALLDIDIKPLQESRNRRFSDRKKSRYKEQNEDPEHEAQRQPCIPDIVIDEVLGDTYVAENEIAQKTMEYTDQNSSSNRYHMYDARDDDIMWL